VRGIDVSHNNGVIDWQKVKAAGIDFAIIRSGHGQKKDTQFDNYIAGANKAGIPFGIYHFSYAANVEQAKAEAEKCLEIIKPVKIDLPVYFDFEDYSEQVNPKVNYTKELRTEICIAFCEAIRKAGYKPGIYTNPNYILYRFNWDKLKGYSLWLAQWPLGGNRNIKFEEVKETAVNTKYGKPDLWQIGKGRINGINTDVDMNYGYCKLPENKPSEPVVTKPEPKPDIKAGDKVRVVNTTTSGGRKRGKIYNSNSTFVVYYDKYDVISVNGDRIVIGIGKTVTAAVHRNDLAKV
jgi:lysozyme